MSDEELLRRLDPVDVAARVGWEQGRRPEVRRQLDELRSDNVVELAGRDHRRPRWLVTAAIILLVLATVSVLRLNDSQSGRATVLHQVPLRQLTLGDGYLWLSSATTAAGSAEEFADVVLGWPDREVSVDSGEPAGPTWVSVTHGGLTIRMMFVPDSAESQRWRLLQLGDGPGLTRRVQADGRTRVDFAAPSSARAGYVVSGNAGDAQQIDLGPSDLERGFIEVKESSTVVIAVFVDEEGEVVGAAGSHG
jgi:hypothetical protein